MRDRLHAGVCSAALLSLLCASPAAAESWWRGLAPLVPAVAPAQPTLSPSDFETEEYRADWGLGMINAAEAYAQGYSGKGVVVGVIDSGLDLEHPEFAGRVLPGRNFLPDQAPDDLTDEETHGTHTSGTVAAARDGVGMHGVAYEATLLPIRSIGDDSPDIVTEAFLFAAAQGVDVINASFGAGPLPPAWIPDPDNPGAYMENPDYELVEIQHVWAQDIETGEAMRVAAAADVVMVFAAGNSFQDQPLVSANPTGGGFLPLIRPENHDTGLYDILVSATNPDDPATYVTLPASDPSFGDLDFSDLEGALLVVVSVGPDGQIASYSNHCGLAAAWCVTAPGGEFPDEDAGETPRDTMIYSTVPGGYDSYAGTSMAAPHVAGVAALVREAFPYMTARQTIQVILTTTDDLGSPEIFGQGLVDAGKAVRGPGAFISDWDVDTQGYNSTWSNDIGGDGGLTKRGLGLLRLTGDNSYGGATQVEGGLLAVEGSILSSVIVGAAGGLSGSGQIDGGVQVAGLLLPGSIVAGEGVVPGTLLVTGPVEMLPGATFAALLDARASGSIVSSQLLVLGPLGGFVADGTLALGLASAADSDDARGLIPLIGRRTRLVTAEQGIEGSFDELDAPTPQGTRFDLIYDTTAIDAVITPERYTALEALGQTLTGNESAVAAAVDAVRAEAGTRLDGDMQRFFDGLYGLSAGALPDSFASLSGQIYGDATIADLASRRLVRSQLYGRLDGSLPGTSASALQLSAAGDGVAFLNQTAAADASATDASGTDATATGATAADPDRWALWGQGLYGFGHTEGDGTAQAVDRDSGGLLLGLDRRFDGVGAGAATVGLAFGYIRSHGDLASGPSADFDIDSYYVSLYGRYEQGPLVLDATLGTAFNRYDVTRDLSVGTLQDSANGTAWGTDVSTSVMAGYRLRAGRVELVPQIGLDYDRLQRDALDESGAGALDLQVDDSVFDALRSLVGGRIRVPLAPDWSAAPLLDLRAYWSHDFADVVADTDALFLGVPVQASTADVSRNAALLGVGLAGSPAPGVQLNLGFSSELRSGQNDQAVNAGVRIAF